MQNMPSWWQHRWGTEPTSNLLPCYYMTCRHWLFKRKSVSRLSSDSLNCNTATSTLLSISTLPAYCSDFGIARLHNWCESSPWNKIFLSLLYWKPLSNTTISSQNISVIPPKLPLSVTTNVPLPPWKPLI